MIECKLRILMLFLIFIGYCAYDAICVQGGAIEDLSTVRGWIEEKDELP